MKSIFKLFTRDENQLRIQKSESNLWMVKKGLTTLYIGTKEKCKIYMNRGQIA